MTSDRSGLSPKRILCLGPCIVFGMLAAGCSTWKSPSSWFGGESTGVEESAQAQTKATPYYTGEASMKLYPEPRFSLSYIVELPLHQKVYRSKVERGFAYVEIEGSGKKGWLDNSKLVWRLQAPTKSAAAPTAAAAPVEESTGDVKAEPAPAAEAKEEPSAAPVEDSILAPAAAEAEEAPPESAEPEDTQNVDPSIFSPF